MLNNKTILLNQNYIISSSYLPATGVRYEEIQERGNYRYEGKGPSQGTVQKNQPCTRQSGIFLSYQRVR